MDRPLKILLTIAAVFFVLIVGAQIAHAADTKYELDFGFTSAYGAIDSTGSTVNMAAKGKHIVLQADHAYSETERQTSTDKGSVGLNASYPVSRRSDVWADIRAGYNNVAGRDLETYAGAGMGRYLFKGNRVSLKLSGGLIHRYEQAEIESSDLMGSWRIKAKRDGRVLDLSCVLNHKHDAQGKYIQDYRIEATEAIPMSGGLVLKLVLSGEGRNNTVPEHMQAIMIGVRL